MEGWGKGGSQRHRSGLWRMSISAKYFQFLHFSESFQLKCCVCITSPSTNSCVPPPPHKLITSLIVTVLHTIHACTNIHAQINSYIVAHM